MMFCAGAPPPPISAGLNLGVMEGTHSVRAPIHPITQFIMIGLRKTYHGDIDSPLGTIMSSPAFVEKFI